MMVMKRLDRDVASMLQVLHEPGSGLLSSAVGPLAGPPDGSATLALADPLTPAGSASRRALLSLTFRRTRAAQEVRVRHQEGAAPVVVVGVDGSVAARRAVAFAAREAALRGASLRVVTALSWPGRHGLGLTPEHQCRRAIADADVVLAEAVELAQELLAPHTVTTVTALGDPAAVLVEESRRAELVVLGNRGPGGFAASMLGSVRVGVVGDAESPVVVVRDRGSHSGRFGDLAPVVVGVDGGAGSRDALTLAFKEAELYRMPLLAVYYWSPPPAGHDQMHRPQGEAALLARALAPYRERFPAVDVVGQVSRGCAGDELVDASAGARLLVVGSRGRGRWADLLLSSVSQAAIHRAHCPVMVVRPVRAALDAG